MKHCPSVIRLTFLLLFIALTSQAQSSVTTAEHKQKVPANYGYILEPGDNVPEFSMKLADGNTVSSNDWKGKVWNKRTCIINLLII